MNNLALKSYCCRNATFTVRRVVERLNKGGAANYATDLTKSF